MRNINTVLLNKRRTSIFIAHRLRTVVDAGLLSFSKWSHVLTRPHGRHYLRAKSGSRGRARNARPAVGNEWTLPCYVVAAERDNRRDAGAAEAMKTSRNHRLWRCYLRVLLICIMYLRYSPVFYFIWVAAESKIPNSMRHAHTLRMLSLVLGSPSLFARCHLLLWSLNRFPMLRYPNSLILFLLELFCIY
jgi:hypothetical protein